MLQRMDEALKEDGFGTWNARALTLAVEKKDFNEIHQKISDFIYQLNKEYSMEEESPTKDLLLQINCQMIQMTRTNEDIRFQKEQERDGR